MLFRTHGGLPLELELEDDDELLLDADVLVVAPPVPPELDALDVAGPAPPVPAELLAVAPELLDEVVLVVLAPPVPAELLVVAPELLVEVVLVVLAPPVPAEVLVDPASGGSASGQPANPPTNAAALVTVSSALMLIQRIRSLPERPRHPCCR